MGNAGNFFKNIAYIGLAGFTGFAGYVVGQSKHWQGVSVATIGLALLLYTPRGCDYLEKRAEINAELEKTKLYHAIKKDSLDAVLNNELEKERSNARIDTTINKISRLESGIKADYDKLLNEMEQKNKRLISESDKKNIEYRHALSLVQEQNEELQANMDTLLAIQKQYAINLNIVDTVYLVQNDVAGGANNTSNNNPSKPYSAVNSGSPKKPVQKTTSNSSTKKHSIINRIKPKSPPMINAITVNEYYRQKGAYGQAVQK